MPKKETPAVKKVTKKNKKVEKVIKVVEAEVKETVEINEEDPENLIEIDGFAEVTKKVEKALKGKEKFWSGVGRRKSSTARVWMFEGRGDILVNGMLIDEYFKDVIEPHLIYLKPFHSVGVSHPKSHFSASIKVSGGGITGQIEAIQLAISKALLKYDGENRPQLRKFSLLTTNAKVKERKKYFLVKARKRPQYSKR